jgi:predicted AAA+ superfamily ATPase
VTGQDLERYVDEHIVGRHYLFVDEIQQIKDRDKAILSIFTRYKDTVTIIIT